MTILRRLPLLVSMLVLLAGCVAAQPRNAGSPGRGELQVDPIAQAYNNCAQGGARQCYPCDGPGLRQVPVEQAQAFCPAQVAMQERVQNGPTPLQGVQPNGLLNLGPQFIPQTQFRSIQPPLPDGAPYPCNQTTGDYVPNSGDTCNIIRRQANCCQKVVQPPQPDCCEAPARRPQPDCCERRGFGGGAVVRPPEPLAEPKVQQEPAPKPHATQRPPAAAWHPCDTCNGPNVSADGGGVAFGTGNKDNKVYVFMPGSQVSVNDGTIVPKADPHQSVVECNGKCTSIDARNGSVAFGRGNEKNTVIPIPPGSKLKVEGVEVEIR